MLIYMLQGIYILDDFSNKFLCSSEFNFNMKFNNFRLSIDGSWLSDPTSKTTRLFVQGLTKGDIAHAENSRSPEKLAVQLLSAVFSDVELATGNCTQPRKKGIVLLDPEKVKAIRGEMSLLTFLHFGFTCTHIHTFTLTSSMIPLLHASHIHHFG